MESNDAMTMLAQLIESTQIPQQQMEQQQARQEADWKRQQARHEADQKLHQQRLDMAMALSEAEVGNALACLREMGLEHEKQKLELKRQVSELTLSLQEREAQISNLQVARHGRGATAEALRQATLEVTALQSQAKEKDRLMEDSQKKFSAEEKKLREATKEVHRQALRGNSLPRRRVGCSSSPMPS